MAKEYRFVGLADKCPLCIDADGRKKPEVFIVACENGYSGPICAPHLAALIRLDQPQQATPAKPADVRPNGPPVEFVFCGECGV